MKRSVLVLIIIIAVVVIVAVGYVLSYPCDRQPFPSLLGYFLTRRCATQPAEGGSLPPATGLPAGGGIPAGGSGVLPGTSGGVATSTAVASLSGSQVFGMVSRGPVADFFVDGENRVTAVQPDGKFVAIISGQVAALTDAAVPNFVSASFSFDGKKVLVAFGNPQNPQFSVFDVSAKEWQPLPINIGGATWSPADHRIVYLVPAGGTAALTVLDAANEKAKPQSLSKFYGEDLTLDWAAPNRILFKEKGSAFALGSLWDFAIKEKILAPVIQDQLGFEIAWDEEATTGIAFISNLNRRGGRLSLVDSGGVTLRELTFLTLPTKCVFNSMTTAAGPALTPTATSSAVIGAPARRTLICAVPRDQEQFSATTLPDAYKKKVVFTTDDFYSINLADGNIRTVFADPNQNLDAENLKIFNGKLFFINRFDGRLYAVSLPLE